MVIFSTIDFNFPYSQRPQHLARAFALDGTLCFYISPSSGYDAFESFGMPMPNLCVTDQLQLVYEQLDKPVVIVVSTDNRITPTWVTTLLNWTPYVIYDYIDHIHPAISMVDIPPERYEAHRMILSDERITVSASADSLFAEVLRFRTKNCLLATNGVFVEDSNTTRGHAGLSENYLQILARKRPIVGYFGALASWFDYALVVQIAQMRPHLSFVLIGPDYDGSSANSIRQSARCLDNLHLIGPVPYVDLCSYAAWFDVALIPFVLNDITEATSPLKLFEYFALGLPVVSTDLPECRKYERVLIGRGSSDFSEKIDAALPLRSSEEYRTWALKEARANSWSAKAKQILDEQVASRAVEPADRR